MYWKTQERYCLDFQEEVDDVRCIVETSDSSVLADGFKDVKNKMTLTLATNMGENIRSH